MEFYLNPKVLSICLNFHPDDELLIVIIITKCSIKYLLNFDVHLQRF